MTRHLVQACLVGIFLIVALAASACEKFGLVRPPAEIAPTATSVNEGAGDLTPVDKPPPSLTYNRPDTTVPTDGPTSMPVVTTYSPSPLPLGTGTGPSLDDKLASHPLNLNLNAFKYTDNPVIARVQGTWESVDVGHIAVLTPAETHDKEWHSWYAGHPGNPIEIGHAMSTDGVSWTKDLRNPVLSVPGKSVNDPFVVPVQTSGRLEYHMFVEFFDPETGAYSIGKSESFDGITWTAVRQVMEAEPKLASEIGVSVALVHRDERSGKWSMLFSGIDAVDPAWVIWTGLAESFDGNHWTKLAVLERRPEKFVFPHALLKKDIFLALFVMARDDIHLAGSSDFRHWTIMPDNILSKSETYENPGGDNAGIGGDGLAMTYYNGTYYVYYSYYANAAGNRDIGVILVNETR